MKKKLSRRERRWPKTHARNTSIGEEYTLGPIGHSPSRSEPEAKSLFFTTVPDLPHREYIAVRQKETAVSGGTVEMFWPLPIWLGAYILTLASHVVRTYRYTCLLRNHARTYTLLLFALSTMAMLGQASISVRPTLACPRYSCSLRSQKTLLPPYSHG